jgi:hypothetical protein
MLNWFKFLFKSSNTCPHDNVRWVMLDMGMSKALICDKCLKILKRI